ncbi:MAG: YihY/virulence factor BrkB family protein [Alphaproteobacteria bacterium]|nr:YihY/virulence factor BrkB family protein [Alphaproteobacteria bacterium]
MAGRHRSAPVLGTLIALALACYAAAGNAAEPTLPRPAPRQNMAPPARPPRRRWGRILARVWDELGRDHVSMMAAGVAFYGLLAIFPGMSALISIYGLVADPGIIERHLAELTGVLPAEALKLLSDQMNALVSAPPAKLGLGLLISLLVALWSAMSGTSMLMQALTVAYEEQDDRGILHFYALALALTVGTTVFGLVSLLLIAAVPVALEWLPMPEAWRDGVALVRWPILAGLVLIGLGLLYRLAPDRRSPRGDFLSPGTIAAAVLWLVGSAGFSIYVARFGSYDRTYGSIGAVVILLMWFYVSAYIVLAGAELNAELERAQHNDGPHPGTPATAPPLPLRERPN